ncbi:hypothetical protein DFJ74DRAFT_290068, partial [Hyaloraphidium curvatum]
IQRPRTVELRSSFPACRTRWSARGSARVLILTGDSGASRVHLFRIPNPPKQHQGIGGPAQEPAPAPGTAPGNSHEPRTGARAAGGGRPGGAGAGGRRPPPRAPRRPGVRPARRGQRLVGPRVPRRRAVRRRAVPRRAAQRACRAAALARRPGAPEPARRGGRHRRAALPRAARAAGRGQRRHRPPLGLGVPAVPGGGPQDVPRRDGARRPRGPGLRLPRHRPRPRGPPRPSPGRLRGALHRVPRHQRGQPLLPPLPPLRPAPPRRRPRPRRDALDHAPCMPGAHHRDVRGADAAGGAGVRAPPDGGPRGGRGPRAVPGGVHGPRCGHVLGPCRAQLGAEVRDRRPAAGSVGGGAGGDDGGARPRAQEVPRGAQLLLLRGRAFPLQDGGEAGGEDGGGEGGDAVPPVRGRGAGPRRSGHPRGRPTGGASGPDS